MTLLRKLSCFGVQRNDLVLLYIMYIRSVLEYCCVVWHSSITVEEIQDLERVQKCAVRVILGNEEKSHEDSLKELGLDLLSIRRKKLCVEFAKKSISNPKTTSWFPKRPLTEHNIRNSSEFEIMHANTERFKKSTIPYLQRLMNGQTFI